jgi:hypothetical protein
MTCAYCQNGKIKISESELADCPNCLPKNEKQLTSLELASELMKEAGITGKPAKEGQDARIDMGRLSMWVRNEEGKFEFVGGASSSLRPDIERVAKKYKAKNFIKFR